MTKELVVPIDDLHYISIECPKCKAVVMFDLKLDFKTPGPGRLPTPQFSIPLQCGVCKNEFKFRDALEDLIASQKLIIEHSAKVSFRIKIED